MEPNPVGTAAVLAAVITLALLALLARVVQLEPAPVPSMPIGLHGPPVGGFADPAWSGICEETFVEIAGDHRGPPTREAAIADVVARGELPVELTVEGHRIVFEGDAVGTITTEEAPAGGYVVVGYEWCHP